ncbi:MAG TPA: hypothetical protein GX497_03405 [Bacillus bacterium]|nr:hypothetical protein [Bacillus sp. (in: firmicutes)]
MPEFQTFFTGARLADFWYYVKWFLFLVAPIVMIFIAAEVVGRIIGVIKSAFSNDKDKDDDDYDVYRY